jgi:hypothetical protein
MEPQMKVGMRTALLCLALVAASAPASAEMVYWECRFEDDNNGESGLYRYDLTTGEVGAYLMLEREFHPGVKAVRPQDGYVSLVMRGGTFVIQIEEGTGRAVAANVQLPENYRAILDGKCERTTRTRL